MFELPKRVKEDIDNYGLALKEFISQNMASDRFKGIRVPWGIYSHRGGKTYMMRIRIPAGILTARQLKALSYCAREWADSVLHITTRQDIQLHNVDIKNTVDVLNYLKDYNLSPRGGGGNTVRNIVGCPFSGICKDEVFDVREYVVGLTEYLLVQQDSYTMPRKFKIAFSGCGKDCCGVRVNDLGFLAVMQDGKKGFKVFVGGGMGLDSRLGILLEEFLPEDDLGYCVQAVKNIFLKRGDRRDKHHNRLRFLIHDDLGEDEFRSLYRQEFKRLKEEEHIVLRKVHFDNNISDGSDKVAELDDDLYKDFINYNCVPQKQQGFYTVVLRIPRGDIEADQLEALAGLEEEFPEIRFITTQNQNLAIAWVKASLLDKLFLQVKSVLNDFLYPDTLLDIVACKGSLTCNLGLCNSPGLAKELEEIVKGGFIKRNVFKKLNIKINGCPNACGQHPLGNIALHGVVKRVCSRSVPFYKVLLGGRKAAEDTRLSKEKGVVPARTVPLMIKEFLERIDGLVEEEEEKFWNEADGIVREVIKKYSYVPPYEEDVSFYRDWGKDEDFSLEGLGKGECGAGVIDMIESDLNEAKVILNDLDKAPSVEDIKKVLLLSARALLVVRGRDPKDDFQIIEYFKKEFLDSGIASCEYNNIEDVFQKLSSSEVKEMGEFISYVKNFFDHINEVYRSMDPSFNFPKQADRKDKTEEVKNKVLDLKGTPCPINYVKTKLFLESLDKGTVIEVLLDEGEPIQNVPKSLANDGHKIIKIERENGWYRVVVEKGN